MFSYGITIVAGRASPATYLVRRERVTFARSTTYTPLDLPIRPACLILNTNIPGAVLPPLSSLIMFFLLPSILSLSLSLLPTTRDRPDTRIPPVMDSNTRGRKKSQPTNKKDFATQTDACKGPGTDKESSHVHLHAQKLFQTTTDGRTDGRTGTHVRRVND
ncbi:hypothetical protein IWX49DRAFT_10321 [Phyllosticta citricarpa]|uniref:Uncharacterized protein n=1 Tax=Phyllosticta paracitricarpa TaxID=2016321 RepID=A0ABR1NAX9_9PEZI